LVDVPPVAFDPPLPPVLLDVPPEPPLVLPPVLLDVPPVPPVGVAWSSPLLLQPSTAATAKKAASVATNPIRFSFK
jgi:hypothetical protein